MDVIWMKRDVRLGDHGPFAEVAKLSNQNTPFLILYLWEPDQLSDPTVHGSHLHFINEGLVDLEQRLQQLQAQQLVRCEKPNQFQCLTVCHATIIDTLESILKRRPIRRLLAHEETGHMQSYIRDKAVRKWCRLHGVQFIEFPQTGVTRCLKTRDDFQKKLKLFLDQPPHATPNMVNLQLQVRLVTLDDLPGKVSSTSLDLDSLLFCDEIPKEHRIDRPGREQRGGETQALATIDSFLQHRGSNYSYHISSPNTSWTSCSRWSVYLTWGHVSLRYCHYRLQQRQAESRRRLVGNKNSNSPWLQSLANFSSRLHWRSHFIQKLESEPLLEKQDLCPAYQSLRRQDGDWNEEYYQAWSTGHTGFPLVDACMRCLLKHGWINFRMRAMLVSFATYNLWLDWKRIAPHLARVFLDYEPGIHYPQLQMQAGTTGINAMRVYNVTKQAQDQDKSGTFIRKHVPELNNVPIKFLFEPWKMSKSMQLSCQVLIGDTSCAAPTEQEQGYWNVYPKPIVNEQESARVAKQKVAAVRNQSQTKQQAQKVYHEHGSRTWRGGQEAKIGKALQQPPQAREIIPSSSSSSRQPQITTFAWNTKQPPPPTTTQATASSIGPAGGERSIPTITNNPYAKTVRTPPPRVTSQSPAQTFSVKVIASRKPVETQKAAFPSLKPAAPPESIEKKRPLPRPPTDPFTAAKRGRRPESSTSSKLLPTTWNCIACTFLNENPLGLACSVCGTTRSTDCLENNSILQL
jgi:deoxyribodipyrimidine photo-lyase